MGKILIPPEYKDISGPLIFLAGPIQGALNWQGEAIEFLKSKTSAHIASPRREMVLDKDFKAEDYNIQVEWEHDYLEYAAVYGVTLFWLAREAEHMCDRSYAQTSRFELGEAVTRHRLEGIKVVVGIEEGFSNKRYLQKTISTKMPNISLCSSLKETCLEAIKLFTTNK